MDVAELVPEVALGRRPRRTTRRARSRPAIASSICRCDASGSCQPVSRPSTASRAALGRDDHVGPALARVHDAPRASTTDSSARTTVVPIAITRPPFGAGLVDARRGRRRNAVPLGIRVLVRFERRHAGVQHERRDADALGDEARDELGCERPPRARHLRAARLARVHVLVHVERPVARDVAVADRPAVHREIREHRDRAGRASRPTAAPTTRTASRGGRSRRRRAAACVPGGSSNHGSVARPFGRRSSTSHRPAGSRCERCTTSGVPSSPSASTAAASVPDVFTTTRSPSSRNCGRSCACVCTTREVGAVRDHHPHRVARDAARFGRLGRFAHRHARS